MIEERRWADRESVRKKLFYLEIPIADDAPLLDRMEGEHTENDDNQPRADG